MCVTNLCIIYCSPDRVKKKFKNDRMNCVWWEFQSAPNTQLLLRDDRARYFPRYYHYEAYMSYIYKQSDKNNAKIFY